MKHCFTSIIGSLLFSINVFAQQATIDTIPFSLETRLLVFKGSINGVPIDFAFDTGAATTVSNTNTNTSAKIELAGGKRKIEDANQQVAKIDNTAIKSLTIGKKQVVSLKALSFDMAFLNCANLVLLGQDVIKRFNWKIDFEKQVLYVSNAPFEVDSLMVTWPVTYKGKRPHINFEVNGRKYINCLIDIGYTQIFEINPQVGMLATEAKNKLAQQKASLHITSSMGLTGLGKPDDVTYFLSDSIYFGNTLFTQVPTSLNAKADTKLGVQFFNGACKQVVFNFSTNTMHLLLKNVPITPMSQLDARVSMQDGKLVISGKNMSANTSATALTIGEVVKSINGKQYTDFTNECEYLLWTYQYKLPTITIEKMNGEVITIKRSALM